MLIQIFLADDHAIVREGLKALLESEPDIEVIGEASNGREAVRLIRRLRPHVAILDVAMPLVNGIEATARIRQTAPDTRVVILSMHSTSEHIFRALSAGAIGYVLKESAPSEVVSAVREAHAGKRFLSQKVQNSVINGYLDLTKSPEKAKSPLDLLTLREREVLQLVAEGKSSAEIGKLLFLSSKTVDTYRSRLMKKLEIRDLAGLIRFAIRHHLTPLD